MYNAVRTQTTDLWLRWGNIRSGGILWCSLCNATATNTQWSPIAIWTHGCAWIVDSFMLDIPSKCWQLDCKLVGSYSAMEQKTSVAYTKRGWVDLVVGRFSGKLYTHAGGLGAPAGTGRTYCVTVVVVVVTISISSSRSSSSTLPSSSSTSPLYSELVHSLSKCLGQILTTASAQWVDKFEGLTVPSRITRYTCIGMDSAERYSAHCNAPTEAGSIEGAKQLPQNQKQQ